MSYFDYCLSLLVYFPKSTIISLNNCYNNCLFKLFNFKRDEINHDIVDESNVASVKETIELNFNNRLNNYKISTFQFRFFNKFLCFTWNLINNPNAPARLKEGIKVVEKSGNEVMELRRNRQFIKEEPTSKYFQQTFSYFFSKLFSQFNIFFYSFCDFKTFLDSEWSYNYLKFIKLFPKFNL